MTHVLIFQGWRWYTPPNNTTKHLFRTLHLLTQDMLHSLGGGLARCVVYCTKLFVFCVGIFVIIQQCEEGSHCIQVSDVCVLKH